MPEYIATYPGLTDDQVRAATPRRTTAEQAAEDVKRAWHNPGGDKRAQHLQVFRIDGERVTPLTVRVRRVTDVRVGV